MTHRQSTGNRWLAIVRLVLFSGIVAMALPTGDSAAHEELETGSSSRHHRVEAVDAIPFDQLNRVTQERLKSVVDHPSFYRRLPVSRIDSDPDFFRFLIRKPEVVVSIWQLMGVTQMTTERLGPYTVKTDDGSGTLSQLELVYGDNHRHVFYGTGSYEGPVLRKKLTGRCVIVIQTGSRLDPQGGFDLTSQLDIFLRVDNATASLLTRTIQPMVGATADHNLTESLKFIERFNHTTRENGPGVKAMSRQLSLDDQTQQSFNQVIDDVYDRAMQQHWRSSLSNDRSVEPQRLTTTALDRGSRYPTGIPAYSRLSRPPESSPAEAQPTIYEDARESPYGSRPSVQARPARLPPNESQVRFPWSPR